MSIRAESDARTAVERPEPGIGSKADVVVRVEGLRKQFKRADGTIVHAIDDVSIDVHAGEFVVLLGPSGCGKTTLLRSIAGLEEPDSGRITVRGVDHFSSDDRINMSPQRRRLGMVFQSYALWPHMTAFKNVAYPLECAPGAKPSKSEIADRVRTVLKLVGIPELERQYPNQMSGGQQQRVALARALVAGNDLVLFDEPLSNVDAKVREQLRYELAEMQRQLGFAALYVTHDQIEAMELADQIAVMDAGRVVQLGPPREIYDRPKALHVANFIGSTNEIRGEIATAGSGCDVTVRTPLGDVLGVAASDDFRVGESVVGVWRPECGTLETDGSRALPDGNCWHGTVEASVFVGSHTEHVVRLEHQTVRLWQPGGELFEAGAAVRVHVPQVRLRVLRAEQDGPSADTTLATTNGEPT